MKGRDQCYASLHLDFHEYLVKPRCRSSVPQRGLYKYYTNYQYITKTFACVGSPHYFARVVCFPIVVKAQLQGFNPYTSITFSLCCKCATCLFARIPRNGMKRSIVICLLYGQRKHFRIAFSFNTILSTIAWFLCLGKSIYCTFCK